MIEEWELAARAVRQDWHHSLPDWAIFSAIFLAYLAWCGVLAQRWIEQTSATDREQQRAIEADCYDGTPSIYETRDAR